MKMQRKNAWKTTHAWLNPYHGICGKHENVTVYIREIKTKQMFLLGTANRDKRPPQCGVDAVLTTKTECRTVLSARYFMNDDDDRWRAQTQSQSLRRASAQQRANAHYTI